MDLRRCSTSQLEELNLYALQRGNLQASVEIRDFQAYYNKNVVVVKGRKIPQGTKGVVFWVKRQHYSRDPWLGWSTRIGIKTDTGETIFTTADNVQVEM